VLLVVAVLLLPAASAVADVHVFMKNGRVSIMAKDATVRQILAEWARVGQTKIVNVDRIPGGPQTLELNDVTETEALDVLLRSLSGYIVAPRAFPAANLSTFDRIIIIPTVAGARPAAQNAAGSAPAALPQLPQNQQAADDDQAQRAARAQDDDRSEGAVVVPAQAESGPVLNPMPRMSIEIAPQGVMPGGGVLPAAATGDAPAAAPRLPAAPAGGVAVPGMIAPVRKPGRPPS
jgi:hypothetical protein